jgi:hypothetical protein
MHDGENCNILRALTVFIGNPEDYPHRKLEILEEKMN